MRRATITPQSSLRAAILIAAAIFISACASYIQQRQAEQQAEKKVAIETDHTRLLVYTSDLDTPYKKLGELQYTDPLNGETIDTDYINEKLRKMAIARWGQQVDAVIHVSTKVGGTETTTISVRGEAVRINDPCSGCRHTYPPPPES
jgi:hypothetical protein